MAHMLKPLKRVLRTIVIASIAGAAIQSIALAQTTQPQTNEQAPPLV
jgi:hypothetical protein